MKTNLKKIAVIFGLMILMAAAFALVVFAEKSDFTPPADFSDITPKNGWVHVGSKSAKADSDGKDIELYYVANAEAYYNESTKTLVLLGDGSISGSYGDWMVREGKCNVPGFQYKLVYWASLNSEGIEHLEIRTGTEFYNLGYVLQTMKHVQDVKLGPTIVGTSGTKSDTGAFMGMTSLVTLGHGKFAKDGKFTPVSYTDRVVDMTGFTTMKPLSGHEQKKALLYHGYMFYGCSSIVEVIFPKTFSYSGEYTPAVEKDGSWVKGAETVKATDDAFGGEYAGVFAMGMFREAVALSSITVPENVEVKVFEERALFGCYGLRCITIKGRVSPDVTVAADSFNGVSEGCIIRCANAADIDVLNKALALHNITNVKAVDMSHEPTPVPYTTTLPVAPGWQEFDPAGATAYGSLTAKYTNNWWAYYKETKTLKIISKSSSGYNEVGDLSQAEDGEGWNAYKEEIEHVVIGPKISKLTAAAFTGMTNLRDIEMTSNINQALGTFKGTPNLTTIFLTGMEKVEGQAMLAGAYHNFKLNFSQTAVKTIYMGSSPWEFVGNIVPGPKTSTIIYNVPPEAVIAYCEENYLNIQDSTGKMIGEWYVPVPEGLPFCGDTAVYEFDKTTGTLYILGKGAVADVGNYWGGGSKNQPWFSIKQQIKHVVVGDYITGLGKYTFTECKNLETVEIPARDGFVILNAAFEDCNGLKSIYIRGNQPVEGTVDISNVYEIESFTFSDCFLLANAVINEKVSKIGVSVFENCSNLQNIYGVPGSGAEKYATKNGLTFYDMATNTPQPITCTPPVTETTSPETEPDTVPDTTSDTAPDTAPVSGGQTAEEPSNVLPVIIVATVALVAVSVAVVVIAKKAAKKN